MKKELKLKLRKATRKDIDALVMLQQELADYHHRIDPNYWSKANISFAKSFRNNILNKKIGKRSTHAILVEFNNEPVGFFLAFFAEASPAIIYKKVGSINNGYVREEFRHSGIGKKAIGEIMNWFKKNDVKIVELGVDIQNEIGKKAWRKMGFEEYVLKMRKIIK